LARSPGDGHAAVHVSFFFRIHHKKEAMAAAAEEKSELFVIDGSAETDLGTGHEKDEEVGNPRSLLGHILASLTQPGVDLSKVLIPPFFLSPNSLIDKMSDNWAHTDLFLAYVPSLDSWSWWCRITNNVSDNTAHVC
jgi:hypothetical protein